MPDVPQSPGDILPAARQHAVKMVAHLRHLGDDLRRIEARRGDDRYTAGAAALAEMIAALDGLIDATASATEPRRPEDV